MTLRVRVALLAAAVVAVAVAAVGWDAVRSARAELTEEVDIDLMARAGLLADQRRRDFFSQVLGLTGQDLRIGPLLRADPLGSLVSLDAHARVVVVDVGPGLEGVVHGEVILTLDDGIGTVPDARRLERARHRDGPMLETVSVEGIRLRLMTVEASDGVFVQVARPLAEVDSAVEDLRQRVLLFGFLAVVAAAAGAWFLAGRAVRPIVRLTRTVEDITATGDLDGEVEGSGPGEVGRLARSFRTMLAALATSRRQQRRLVMDASHELRTPLTSLRTNVDLLRRSDEMPPTDRASVLDDVDAELGELTELVTELVDLAADVQADEELELIDVVEVVEPVLERARRRSGRDIALRVERGVPVEGRPEALARAVRNLVDNAVKFSSDGPVEVVVDGGSVTVHDAGPGIPGADRERVFERFHRLEVDRDEPGSGLGLAIVRHVAEAHGGTVWAGDSPLGGAAVGLRIPEIDE
ncbi:MAG: HAMP domain-containing histidine kinase [Acidimicrobiaceae bacterium]|nr:HAMP domain-containing histidine kinase [Acidimicrobiaceae bacterium]MYG97837.1 HAMP domain-containing histidine kinase [Acidimicrobiaceae bacterium]MYL02884.1 HAMP domain-containing histidine kinase [Acidimicrobiaceae bacterium]